MEQTRDFQASWPSLVLSLCAILASIIWLCIRPMAALADGPGDGPTNVSDGPVGYRVVFEGVRDKDLLRLLRSVSASDRLSGKPADSIFLLRTRVQADAGNLLTALKSRGRYAAAVSASVDESASPVLVRFTVRSATPFILDTVVIALAGAATSDFTLPEAKDLGLDVGAPALSKDIVAAGDKLLLAFKNNGHPFAVLAKRRVAADFSTKTVQVTYVVNPGPRADFGPTTFTGLTEVKESYLETLIPWRQGEQYKQEQVDRLRAKLLELGLFATVAVAPEKELDAQGRVVMAVALTERKKRTIKAGAYYKTDEGPGGKLYWEHRNLFGQGEKLKLNLAASAINQTFEASFEKPSFFNPRQQLLADFKATGQNTTAYQGQNATALIGLGRDLTDSVKAKAALGYRASLVRYDAANPFETNADWGLAFLPLELILNTRDNVLDPTKGVFLDVKAAPYLDTLGHNLDFAKGEIAAAYYRQLLAAPELILAVRAALGSIVGAQAQAIPPDVRFYAGGSDSVRGYGYQLAGPLRGSKPLGGDSLFDFGSELRLRLTETIGVVAFLDGGNVYTQSLPAPGQGLLLGAGLGLRIKTPVGPLRLDVATPLMRRKDVDNQFQFYVGLGQAF